MRIYLAASFSRKEELKKYREDMEAIGHECSSRWLDVEANDAAADLTLDEKTLQKYARKDLEDVVGSDMLIVFSEEEGVAARGGKHVEYGCALGCGIDVAVVGRTEHLFHHMKGVPVYTNWEECLAAITY